LKIIFVQKNVRKNIRSKIKKIKINWILVNYKYEWLEKSLLSSESIKIADYKSPFWYTSGTIGPYFINTHFLLGNENNANDLLSFIDEKKG